MKSIPVNQRPHPVHLPVDVRPRSIVVDDQLHLVPLVDAKLFGRVHVVVALLMRRQTDVDAGLTGVDLHD